jgi:hypothetical protein
MSTTRIDPTGPDRRLPRLRTAAIRTVFSALLAALSVSGHAATFHVDSAAGDDSAPGTSPAQAWRSLERVNAQVFQPGDQLRFKSGGRWTGQLRPQGSGKLVESRPVPIVVDRYGEGPLPRIDGEGRVLDTLLLRNVEFWEVRDLEITNQGTNRAPWRTGVRIVSDGFGELRHIHLRGLFVHDVNGDLRKEQEGCGIFFESRGGNRSHFADLRIEDCHLLRTDRNGICQRGGGRTRSTGVVIRGNLLEDIGGDGIKPWGSDAPLVERNTVRGGRMRCEDYAAGIWPFDCDDALIQFNEVSGMKGTKDGQGFDSDYRCRRSVFQYNYSHDNEGGFFLICAPGNSFNEDTIIRYNISQNDGVNSARVFHFGGGASRTRIYHNTIFIGTNQDLPLVLATEWNGGWADDTRFENNLIYVAGRVSFQLGAARGMVFTNNLLFGAHGALPDGLNATTNRPPLARPGSGGAGFESMAGYRLTERPPWMLGHPIPANGGRDFFGTATPTNAPASIGAVEFKP